MIGIGIIGLGTVGKGTYDVLTDNRSVIFKKTGLIYLLLLLQSLMMIGALPLGVMTLIFFGMHMILFGIHLSILWSS